MKQHFLANTFGVCILLALVTVAVVPAIIHSQGQANFSGTWKLTLADPPVPAGRGGGGGGGGNNGPYAATMFAPAPDTMTITQSASSITVQIGQSKIVYTLDNQLTELPRGDVMAFKSRAHWENGALHLHNKQGMNWGRDVLTMSGTTLTVVRDLESGGGSSTRTLKYTKTG
jgi:hypothetical protein